MCSGNKMAQCIGGPEFKSSRNLLFFISSFLFFPSFSCFSQCSFVLILYMTLVFFLMYKFFPYCLISFSFFFLLFPRSASRGPAILWATDQRVFTTQAKISDLIMLLTYLLGLIVINTHSILFG